VQFSGRRLVSIAAAGLVVGGLVAVPFSGGHAVPSPPTSTVVAPAPTTAAATTVALTTTVAPTTVAPTTTLGVLAPTAPVPAVDAAAYIVYDAAAGRVLAESDADRPAAVGSLMKLLTAHVVMQAGDPEKLVRVPQLTLDPRESQIGLLAGEQWSRAVLLRAMVIVSANDAAQTLALDVGGSQEQFVAMMNAAAAELGLTSTVARNPVGLDAAGQQSSARDVLTLSIALMQDPTFRATVARPSARLHGMTFPATNDLLRDYPGGDGIKTGRTTQAGYCIAGSATRDGRQVIVVVLGSSSDPARLASTAALLDWAFSGA
jgi:D-alanyl-D-alanine carboxypeptidase (penicillin-binding protein 5/6)